MEQEENQPYVEVIHIFIVAVPLLGGYEKFAGRVVISNILKMKPHYKLKLKVLFAKIDSWDNEALQIKVDSKVVY